VGDRGWAERQLARIKRAYADLVVGRSRVRVVAASEDELGTPPIFVIGVFRSGTTLVRYILDSHSRIACPGETSFLQQLSEMSSQDRSLQGFEAMGFDRDALLVQQRRFARYFYDNYARSRGKARWADKSPMYVDEIDYLYELFPRSSFLYVVRHPLDQVHSHTRAGTRAPEYLREYGAPEEDARLAASRYWTDKTAAILDAEENYPGLGLRVRYEDLCRDPEGVARAIFDHIGEAWEETAVRFWEFDHDQGNEDDRIRTTRRYAISTGGFQSWPSHIIDACWEIVADTASRAGYGFDANP
jgi:protein-tyrosine sulfotransferase